MICHVCKKTRHDFIYLSFVIFSGSLGTMTPRHLSVENKILLKPVIGGVRDVSLFIISHEQTQETDSAIFTT